jgi:hypothetical protein
MAGRCAHSFSVARAAATNAITEAFETVAQKGSAQMTKTTETASNTARSCQTAVPTEKWEYVPKEGEMTQTVEEKNKALVLEAFETLFNKKDYAAAKRFWSPSYFNIASTSRQAAMVCSN